MVEKFNAKFRIIYLININRLGYVFGWTKGEFIYAEKGLPIKLGTKRNMFSAILKKTKFQSTLRQDRT